jgi:hypothetical protein
VALALLRDPEEIRMWLGEKDAHLAEIKALLRPYDGLLVMREQEASKPAAKPQKPKASAKTKETAPDLF